MQAKLKQLLTLIERLAEGHHELADLIGRQREAMRRARPRDLDELGGRIESAVLAIGELELARRGLCDALAPALGLAVSNGAPLKLAALNERVSGPLAGRLRDAADRLAGQIQRVRDAERVNRRVAGRMSDFFNDLLGEIARLGRETGCYDPSGRKTLSEVPTGPTCISTVG